jgi:hypothetical protein
MRKLIFIVTIISTFMLAACTSLYLEKGFKTEADYEFAIAKNLSPAGVSRFAQYEIFNANSYTKTYEEMRAISYSSDSNPDTLLAYLKDKKEATAKGIGVNDQKFARMEEERKLAEAAAKEKANLEKEALLKMKGLLAKASIKSCDQFLSAFRQRYEYANFWANSTCEITTDNEAAFVITSRNPNANANPQYSIKKFYYQPSTETVLTIHGPDKAKLRVANFLDVKIITDMNSADEFNFRYIPPKQQATVCSRIKSVSNTIVQQLDFTSVAGYEVAEIAKSGNWDFSVVKTNQSCMLKFDVQGQFKGNTYRKTITCSIGEVVKRPDGYFVQFIDTVGRCRG